MTNAPDDPARRRFLQLMGASLALAGGACSGPPPENIVPYVDLPPELADAKPLFYASAHLHDGYAQGVLIENNQGRPTKIEGNPDHPASLGATSVHAQAAVLQLWDPERSQTVFARSGISTWSAFDAALDARLARFARTGGAGLRLLTGPFTSPTLLGQMRALLAKYPQAQWHVHDGLGRNGFDGARLAFGRALDSIHRFDAARVVVTLDADVLSGGAASVRYARDLASRRVRPARETLSRLYALECTPGLVGAIADERLALPPHEIERAIWRTAALLDLAPRSAFPVNVSTQRWEAALAEALRESRGASLVVAGERLTPATHALVHRMNAALGNAGRTVTYIEPVAATATAASLDALAADMHAGRVDTLFVLGVNPVYDAPADLEFAKALESVATSIHCGLYRDETARACAWHVPEPHVFESWSDARAYDGTATIVQPAMRPRFDARSRHELLSRLTGVRENAFDSVRRTWQPRLAAAGERAWRDSLRRGVVEGTAAAPVAAPAVRATQPPALVDAPLVAVFASDPSTHDGAYANNAWLQELPRPLTKMVWDNAALMSPRTAGALHVRTGDRVRVSAQGRVVDAPVWVQAGHADGAVTLPLGYGRRAAGDVGNGVGFDAYPLHTRAARAAPLPVALEKTGARHAFATTQNPMRAHGRDLARHAKLDDFAKNPRFANDEKKERVPEETLYPEFPYRDYKWGMAIDLNACIGCGACTIACQAENNIPVVGKEQVAIGREMHWIRIDRYYEGPVDKPRTLFQPVPCMHCEHAPCEEVCPVGATVHDSEGLNLQVYNRCVGTRFCSQNCPYKVRRFNFLQFSDEHDPGLKAVRNPEVSVRGRGVMEKCTYCLQRITRARIEAEKLGRRIADGEVVTACQAVCPTRAITFGDLNDPKSAVNRAKASDLDYALLAELNTRPRTSYLARIENPDPKLEES